MADTTAPPTPTPDATATAPTAQPTTPDYSTQPAQLSAPAPAAPAPTQPAQPSGPPVASAPASAATGAMPGVHGILGSVVVGALKGVAQHLAKGVGHELNTFARQSPYGQELQKNALERQQAQQNMQVKQKEEQRAEQTAQQLAKKAEEESGKAMDEHQTALLTHNNLSMSQLHTATMNHIEEQEKIKSIVDANDTFKTQLASWGIKPKFEAHSFDDLNQDHAEGIATSTLTPLAHDGTKTDAGLHLFNTDDLKNTPLMEDAVIPTDYHVDPKTGELRPTKTATLPAGSTDAYKAWQLASSEQAKGQLELARFEQKQKAEKEQAGIEETQAGTKQKGAESFKETEEGVKAGKEAGLLGGQQLEHTASQLVDANEDPSQMTKREKNYDQVMNAADDYSMKTYGVHWSPAQASIDFKYAQNPQTQNTLRYLNSLTGKDGKSGNLGQLISLSNKITRTDFPALNDAVAWGKIESGDPQMAAYRATLTEVSDQVAKILQGGGTGSGTSDTKLKQAQSLFDQRFSKTQIQAIAGSLQPLLGNRQREMIGDNRYLIKMFPEAAAPAGTVSIGTNPADGKDYYLDAKGQPIHVVGYGVR